MVGASCCYTHSRSAHPAGRQDRFEHLVRERALVVIRDDHRVHSSRHTLEPSQQPHLNRRAERLPLFPVNARDVVRAGADTDLDLDVAVSVGNQAGDANMQAAQLILQRAPRVIAPDDAKGNRPRAQRLQVDYHVGRAAWMRRAFEPVHFDHRHGGFRRQPGDATADDAGRA